MFKLHERLEKDLILVEEMKLSKLMLLPDSENPWFVIVPRVDEVREIHELSQSNQMILLEEINHISRYMMDSFKPNKLNIGSLGNMVPQLHILIICRYECDRAWPGAIWGTKPLKSSYDSSQIIREYINR